MLHLGNLQGVNAVGDQSYTAFPNTGTIIQQPSASGHGRVWMTCDGCGAGLSRWLYRAGRPEL